MKKSKYLSMAIALAVMTASSSVFAAEVADFGDEDVVVTATRTEKKDVDVPASTEVITAQQIEEMGAKSAADALSKVNGLTFKSFGQLNAAMGTMINEITIRGIDNGTMIMMNGVPISMRTKYDISAIPASIIERIEIIKGAGTTLYGSQAMAGVVNIITKNPEGPFGGDATIGFGSQGQQLYYVNATADNFSVFFNKQKWNGSHDATVSDFDYNGPAKTDKNKFKGETHTWVRDIEKTSAGFNFKFNDRFNVMYDYNQSVGTYDRYITSLAATNKYSATLHADVGDFFNSRKYTVTQHNAQALYSDNLWKLKFFYNTGTFESIGPSAFFLGTSSNGSGSYNTKNGWYSNDNQNWYNTKERNTTIGTDIQRTWQLEKGSNVIVGANAQRESYESCVTAYDPSNERYARNVWAAFAQLDYNFDDKNNIIIGARETWTSGTALNYSNFSGSVAYTYKLGNENNIYAAVNQSFILPTFAQMYGASDMAVPNPGLKPQKGVNYEIGWKQKHGAHTWKAALFKTDIEDNISATWSDKKRSYSYKNEDFRNEGLELSCSIEPENSKFSFDYGLTWQNPVVKSTKKDYWDRKYGKIQLTGAIRYKVGKFTGVLDASFLGNRVNTPSSEHSFETKPYLLTGLNLMYSPTDKCDVSLKIDNLLNRKDILSHSSSIYYSAPISFLLSVTQKF
ncbi:TonB-dependent receptor [Anaerovibrio sp. JC8]|uniref:TonB-dependent receptor plug domain-containing protein n=1 Tax=Anaerovibrio sp. JC8 TaxID=1240085 RepID=UPI000A0B815D|nr:TonB-dependent receptor [Anaerovibrio sp. JC8]ORT99156.1 TonB-dependent receptor [Anaerovibrio sp. JC8]